MGERVVQTCELISLEFLCVRCGFEGVRQRSRAVRVSNLEIRCQVPPRTVGISRVYLTARDARGLPSVVSANVGMIAAGVH